MFFFPVPWSLNNNDSLYCKHKFIHKLNLKKSFKMVVIVNPKRTDMRVIWCQVYCLWMWESTDPLCSNMRVLHTFYFFNPFAFTNGYLKIYIWNFWLHALDLFSVQTIDVDLTLVCLHRKRWVLFSSVSTPHDRTCAWNLKPLWRTNTPTNHRQPTVTFSQSQPVSATSISVRHNDVSLSKCKYKHLFYLVAFEFF